ncbi:MAG: hypothetical protein QNJ13_08050 [Paracoccaceae bacterium]|nr:hypothetical protein [Paracoccaceae bacterium]
MPLLRVNAEGGRPLCQGGDPAGPALKAALAALPPGAPVVLMLHGYKYDPGDRRRCPHRSIFAATSSPSLRRCRSWPRAMGFGGADRAEGLCIAFGWRATGTIWQAAAAADGAGAALGALFDEVTLRTGRPVHVLAHSLGARVALTGLSGLPSGTVGRIVLLHGAEFRSRARAALATPAGAAAEVFNITTRENDLFDGLFRACVAPHRPLDPALSAGLGTHRANWLDIRIDDAASRAALAGIGFDIPAPERRICHWSAYMRPGMFDLHRALLREPAATPLPALAARLPDGARRGALETLLRRFRPPPLPGPARVPS